MTIYEQNWQQLEPLTEYEDEYDDFYYPPEFSEIPTGYYNNDLVQQRMIILVTFVVIAVSVFGLTVIARWQWTDISEEVASAAIPIDAVADVVEAEVAVVVNGRIAPLFSREVQYWEQEIVKWANDRGLDPNMAATIMQIESCGDLQAVSRAGAQGLFQVMPFHFSPGENTLDPDTNAGRGLDYFVEQLGRFGSVNMAFAAYNGGPGNASKNYNDWPHETKRYYYWGEGIYADAQAGLATSSRLQEWMEAGGASLCRQAANRLGLQ